MHELAENEKLMGWLYVGGIPDKVKPETPQVRRSRQGAQGAVVVRFARDGRVAIARATSVSAVPATVVQANG